MRETLDAMCDALGWSDASSALGAVIHSGAKVLIKPNLVMHENRGPWGLDPLVTNTGLIQALTEAALETTAQSVTVGDAPIQSCDFAALLAAGLALRFRRRRG